MGSPSRMHSSAPEIVQACNQSDEPGIGGSSRSCLHAKHDIVSFSLCKRSLLVLRFASCKAVLGEPGISGSSRSCLHAKHDVVSFSLCKRSLLVLRFASCEAGLGEPGIGGSSRSVRIFRPSGECTAVGRGRRKILRDETSAVPGGLDRLTMVQPLAFAYGEACFTFASRERRRSVSGRIRRPAPGRCGRPGD